MTQPKTTVKPFRDLHYKPFCRMNLSINVLTLLTYLKQMSLLQNDFIHWIMHGTIATRFNWVASERSDLTSSQQLLFTFFSIPLSSVIALTSVHVIGRTWPSCEWWEPTVSSQRHSQHVFKNIKYQGVEGWEYCCYRQSGPLTLAV